MDTEKKLLTIAAGHYQALLVNEKANTTFIPNFTRPGSRLSGLAKAYLRSFLCAALDLLHPFPLKHILRRTA